MGLKEESETGTLIFFVECSDTTYDEEEDPFHPCPAHHPLLDLCSLSLRPSALFSIPHTHLFLGGPCMFFFSNNIFPTLLFAI